MRGHIKCGSVVAPTFVLEKQAKEEEMNVAERTLSKVKKDMASENQKIFEVDAKILKQRNPRTSWAKQLSQFMKSSKPYNNISLSSTMAQPNQKSNRRIECST
jgi:hypothetical protein